MLHESVPLRAVIFDLDGTLASTERANAESMRRAMRAGQGIEVTQAEHDFVIGHSHREIYRMLADSYPAMSWSLDELIAASAVEREAILAESGVPAMPGAIAAVRRFAHLPRAIVTGSARVEARSSLRAIGLYDEFQAIYAAEDVPSSKPAPDGYLMAARALDVDPRDCLVVEDSQVGIDAGVAAGARVVAVQAGNFLGQDQSAAHCAIATLDELTLELAAGLWS